MSTELETKKVYDGMSPALATTLQGMAEDLRNLIRRTADDLFRIGAIMYDVSQSLKGDNFSDWCDQELGIKRSTAYNYLQIYKRFSSHVNSPNDDTKGQENRGTFEINHGLSPVWGRNESKEQKQGYSTRDHRL